jgi:hypothetical protein
VSPVVEAALFYGLPVLVLVVLLWPTVSAGRRFLRRWGVQDPDDQQVAHAVRYLRDRRLLYPVLFVPAPVVAGPAARALGFANQEPGAFRHLASLIVALLIAEAAVALRPVRGPRTATLTRRQWRDLVPRWAIGTLLVLGAVAASLAVAGLLAQPWASRVSAVIPADGSTRWGNGGSFTVSAEYHAEMDDPVSLVVLTGVVLGLLVVLGVVRLAVRRRSVADPLVDIALRTRSARVAVGIGIAWMGSMVLVANNRLGFLHSFHFPWQEFPPEPAWLEHVAAFGFLSLVAFLVGVTGWIWVANPPRRLSAGRTAA